MNETVCEHKNSVFECKECTKEVFDSFLKMKTEQGISITEMFNHMWTEESTTQYHIHSPEFLRQT